MVALLHPTLTNFTSSASTFTAFSHQQRNTITELIFFDGMTSSLHRPTSIGDQSDAALESFFKDHKCVDVCGKLKLGQLSKTKKKYNEAKKTTSTCGAG